MRKNEKGSTLVTAVLILLALTMIGLGAVTSSSIFTDVSSNLKVKTTAYHAAEACLYYQIRRIKDTGVGTTSLSYDLGGGLSCTATAPVSTGGTGSSSGTLDGYSIEEGAAAIGTIPYEFTVVGNGPRGATSTIQVGINLAAAGGGY